jgi:hypothetical protein
VLAVLWQVTDSGVDFRTALDVPAMPLRTR